MQLLIIGVLSGFILGIIGTFIFPAGIFSVGWWVFIIITNLLVNFLINFLVNF